MVAGWSFLGADGSFDAVVSTFGVMFTPNQDKAASELLRVCKSGGKIGLANWTPVGFIGRLFKVIGAHLPPPSGLRSGNSACAMLKPCGQRRRHTAPKVLTKSR